MLTTIALIKSDYLNEPNSDKDTILTNLLTQASKKIESMCGQPLEVTSVTDYFNGFGEQTKLIKYTSPYSITSLSYREDPLDSWTAISSANYTNYGNVFYFSEGFNDPYYKLVLSVGYSTIPDDLKHYASELTVAYYKATMLIDNTIGVDSSSISQGGVTNTKAVLDVEKQIESKLTRYKFIGL